MGELNDRNAPPVQRVDAGRGGLRRRAWQPLLWAIAAAEIALMCLESFVGAVALWAVVVLAGERARLQQPVALAVLGPAPQSQPRSAERKANRGRRACGVVKQATAVIAGDRGRRSHEMSRTLMQRGGTAWSMWMSVSCRMVMGSRAASTVAMAPPAIELGSTSTGTRTLPKKTSFFSFSRIIMA